MLFLKIIAPILIFVVGFIGILREGKYGDRRTKKHKRIVRLLILFMMVFCVISVGIVLDDHKRQLESQDQIEELHSQMGPFLNMARTFFPDQTDDTALARLARKIDGLGSQITDAERRTREEISRRDYRPLARASRDSVTAAVAHIRQSSEPRIRSILVECQEGNSDRRLVANELVALLRSSGFEPVVFRSVMVLGRSNPNPVVITYPPDSYATVKRLVSSLEPFIRTDYWGQPDTNMADDSLQIFMDGTPHFEPNGSLWLR